jgi:hypothetical protein
MSHEPLAASPPAENLQFHLRLPAVGGKSDVRPRAERGVHVQTALLGEVFRLDYLRHTLKASSHSYHMRAALIPSYSHKKRDIQEE